MHILLINPYYPISETPSPPLGLAFLAGALERAGCEVDILDLVVYPFSQGRLARLLQDFRQIKTQVYCQRQTDDYH